MESSGILEKDVDVVRQDLIRTIQRHPAAMGNSAVALCALLELALNLGLQTVGLDCTRKLFNFVLDSATGQPQIPPRLCP
jgi:hypothetical protein